MHQLQTSDNFAHRTTKAHTNAQILLYQVVLVLCHRYSDNQTHLNRGNTRVNSHTHSGSMVPVKSIYMSHKTQKKVKIHEKRPTEPQFESSSFHPSDPTGLLFQCYEIQMSLIPKGRECGDRVVLTAVTERETSSLREKPLLNPHRSGLL